MINNLLSSEFILFNDLTRLTNDHQVLNKMIDNIKTCQLKIDTCRRLLSDLVLIESLYHGFPSESMRKALFDARNLLEHQEGIFRNIQRKEQLNRLSG